MSRKAKITRKTKETSISVAVNLDGKGKYKIKTGIAPKNDLKKPIVIGPNEYVAIFILKKADAHINDNKVNNK